MKRHTGSTTHISIVIVTYDNARIILPCLASLADSVRSMNSQLFVIDNASRDGTAALLEENVKWLKDRFSAVKVLYNHKNLGFTRAVNQGLRACSGEYIALLNPDVILSPETIPTLIRCLKSAKRIGMVAPQLRFPNGGIQPSCRRFPRKLDVLVEVALFNWIFSFLRRSNSWRMTDFDHRTSRWVDQPLGAFLLAKRQVVEETGLLDERFFIFFSDVDWCRRVNQKGWLIRFCAETSALHLKGDSIYRNRLPMIVSSHRSFVQYFSKYDRGGGQKIVTAFINFLLLLILLPRIIIEHVFLPKGKSSTF